MSGSSSESEAGSPLARIRSMTSSRTPARRAAPTCAAQANKPSEIPGYLSFRWPLAIWDALFTESGAYVSSKEHDAAWNRGAYLVEGLGHCGACHTPRGWAFQEKALDDGSSTYLKGAELDAWFAPNLRGDQLTGLGV